MFLPEPPPSAAVDAAYANDVEHNGYVDNNTRLWSHRPDVAAGFTELRSRLTAGSTLTERELAVLLVAAVSVRADSYCALAWGTRLARLADQDVAAAVVAGDSPAELTPREAALASWARAVAADPNATDQAGVDRLLNAGLTAREVFEATAFVAFRLAFSTVDNALGAEPDLQLARSAPAPVRDAVTFGRAPAATAS